MGLFGGKKTYVSTVIYNMAGDEAKRPNYIRSVIGSTIVAGDSSDLAGTIQYNYMNGPGIALRSFYRWAQITDNYSSIGVPTATLGSSFDLDDNVLIANIPHDTTQTMGIQKSEVGLADYSYWAEQWMLNNHPDLFNTAWDSDIDNTTNLITITFADATTASFTPTGFDAQNLYIFVTYQLVSGTSTGPVETGDTHTLAPGDDYPDTTGWTLVSSSGSETIYTRTDYAGQDPDTDSLYSLKQTMYQDKDLVGLKTYRIDTQKLFEQTWGPLQIFIYEIGSGNAALDAMVTTTSASGEYFPYIPCRLNNVSLEHLNDAGEYPLVYTEADNAYKKLTKKHISVIIDSINANTNIKDIDYAYVAFGVVLNVVEVSCKKYLYAYFTRLMNAQTTTESQYTDWNTAKTAYASATVAWTAWKAAQSDPTNALYGTTEPVIPAYPTLPTNLIKIASKPTVGHFTTDFDMEITWQNIRQDAGTGMLDAANHPVGDLWFSVGGTDSIDYDIYAHGFTLPQTDDINSVTLYNQVDANNWTALIITGMVHRNYIYNGKYVETLASDAVVDTDESAFLVPLHYPTFTSLSIVDYTQMATACVFIVFNCYKVVKQKWYETGIFKIIVIVVIIAVSVATGGLGTAAAPGVLGTAGAVGASLGLTGIAAVIAGTIANAIAAALIMAIVSKVSVAIFGAKIGLIIGTIAGFFAVNIASNFAVTGSLSVNWGAMMRVDNLLKLTSATVGSVSQVINLSVQDVTAKTNALNDETKDQQQNIEDLYAQNIGYDTTIIDPTLLTDAGAVQYESPDSFFSRTLMTGSDVSDISMNMVTNFADLTLSLDLQH